MAEASYIYRALLAALVASVALLAACATERDYRPRVYGGNAERGRAALVALECGVCHVIPGIPGAVSNVAPPLNAFSRHSYIAGKWPNEPERLVAWIRDPPAMAPRTAMPKIPMSDRDARDVAAYLYGLE